MSENKQTHVTKAVNGLAEQAAKQPLTDLFYYFFKILVLKMEPAMTIFSVPWRKPESWSPRQMIACYKARATPPSATCIK